MLMHHLSGVVDVLNGVLGLGLFIDCHGGNALRRGELGHGVGFDELIVGGSSGHDEAWRYACFIFADPFEDALALLGRGGAVESRRSAEHDDGIEMGGGGVVRGQGDVVAVQDKNEDKCDNGKREDGSSE